MIPPFELKALLRDPERLRQRLALAMVMSGPHLVRARQKPKVEPKR